MIETTHPSQESHVEGPSSLDWRTLVALLRRRLWLIVLCIAAGLALGLHKIENAQSIYAARTVIQVEQKEQQIMDIKSVSENDLRFPDLLNTIVQSMTGRSVLLRVVEANRLHENADFLPPGPGGARTPEEAATYLAGCVRAELRRNTRLIDVTVEHPNAAVAVLLADSIVKEYVRSGYEHHSLAVRGANEFLTDEANRLTAKLQKSEEALQRYKQENNAVSLEDRQNIVVEQLKDLSNRLGDARAERMQLEADYAKVRESGEATLDLQSIRSITASPIVVAATNNLRARAAEVDLLSQRYGSRHPRLIAARSELRGLNDSLGQALVEAAAGVSSAYEAALAREQEFERALATQEQKALELNRMAIQYNVLARDVETDVALFQSVLQRLKETDLTKGLDQSPVRVMEPAFSSSVPVRPDRLKILQVSLFFGLVAGIGLSVALNSLDGTFASVEEAERQLGLPALSCVPKLKKLRHRAGSLALLTDRQAAEAFRLLRASLALGRSAQDRKSVLFTSALPQEGKSFSSANYAAALAQQGLSTLLIDADLRNPRISSIFFGKRRTPGLTECLQKTASLDEALCATEVPKLTVLPAGALSPDQSELLSSPALAALLREAGQRFDRIVIDSAPISAVSDTLMVVPNVDAVCLVIRAGKAPRQAVLRVCRVLEEIGRSPVGFILNRVAKYDSGYAYRSYYGYGAEAQTEAMPESVAA